MDDKRSKSLRPASQSSCSDHSKAAEAVPQETKGQSKSSRKQNAERNKTGKGRRRDRGKKNDDVGVKLVLRLLPPDLSQDQFLETIKPEVGEFSDCGVLEWYYVRGHYPQKLSTRPVYSRCYLIFESTESLAEFTKKVQPIKFVDDKDNATNVMTRVSTYVKRFVPNTVGPSPVSAALEGTITEDPLFLTFMKSLKILEEKKSDYSFADVSILKPLEKEVAKQKAVESEIQRKTENALIALTGDSGKKKKKEKKKGKKKELKPKEEAGGENTSGRKRKGTKKKNKALKGGENATKDSVKNNNIVILEAAGKKELQRRKKMQLEKEKALESPSKAKTKPKQRVRGKSEDSEDGTKLKMLKRKIPEQS